MHAIGRGRRQRDGDHGGARSQDLGRSAEVRHCGQQKEDGEGGGADGAGPADAVAATDAAAAAHELEALSPTALSVTLEAVRRARKLPSLEDALEQEFRAVSWFIHQHDLHEGIRAQVIDKDRNPKWDPPTLDAIPPTLPEFVLTEQHYDPVWPDRVPAPAGGSAGPAGSAG